MFKKITFLILLLFVSVAVSGCSQKTVKSYNPQDSEQLLIPYYNSQDGYSLLFPKNWAEVTIQRTFHTFEETQISTSIFGLPGQQDLFEISIFPQNNWDNLSNKNDYLFLGQKGEQIYVGKIKGENLVNKNLIPKASMVPIIIKTFKFTD